jgi:hypothetical protein
METKSGPHKNDPLANQNIVSEHRFTIRGLSAQLRIRIRMILFTDDRSAMV